MPFETCSLLIQPKSTQTHNAKTENYIKNTRTLPTKKLDKQVRFPMAHEPIPIENSSCDREKTDQDEDNLRYRHRVVSLKTFHKMQRIPPEMPLHQPCHPGHLKSFEVVHLLVNHLPDVWDDPTEHSFHSFDLYRNLQSKFIGPPNVSVEDCRSNRLNQAIHQPFNILVRQDVRSSFGAGLPFSINFRRVLRVSQGAASACPYWLKKSGWMVVVTCSPRKCLPWCLIPYQLPSCIGMVLIFRECVTGLHLQYTR